MEKLDLKTIIISIIIIILMLLIIVASTVFQYNAYSVSVFHPESFVDFDYKIEKETSTVYITPKVNIKNFNFKLRFATGTGAYYEEYCIEKAYADEMITYTYSTKEIIEKLGNRILFGMGVNFCAGEEPIKIQYKSYMDHMKKMMEEYNG